MLSLRNPNRKYSFYYERLNTVAFYDGYQFAHAGSLRNYQGRNSWMSLNVSLEGRSTVSTDSVRQGFEREKGEGFFHVRVKIYATVRLKMFMIKSEQFKPDLDCNLRLPVPSNDTSLAAGFYRTECEANHFS
ncbi:NDR1/HIN1-like protein 10 [Phalaenopsis equestris]|nr:NDR1/HIN1-like protein 10 [Phalaenopsis equestris]